MKIIHYFQGKRLKGFFTKYRIDMLAFAVFVAAGIIFAGRPDMEIKLQQAQPENVEVKPSKQTETKSQQPANYKHIEDRNIFSQEGSYEATKGLLQIPENPYNLVAVLRGKEKRAVFREFTGNMVSLKVGDRLIDGAVVNDIDDMSVKIKKGRETKEYRIFEVKSKIKNKNEK